MTIPIKKMQKFSRKTARILSGGKVCTFCGFVSKSKIYACERCGRIHPKHSVVCNEVLNSIAKGKEIDTEYIKRMMK